MTKSFTLESVSVPSAKDPNLFARFEVTICIECRDQDGCDATFDVESVWNLETDERVELSSLPDEEQARIEREAQSLADENACDAWTDYEAGRADAAYDAWKDGEYGPE